MQFNMDKLFHSVEKGLYVFIAVILAASSLFLTLEEIKAFINFFTVTDPIMWIVDIISKCLLLLMIVEILYTVRISFKNQTLIAEPFLIVAMIAAVRRILLISVETAYMPDEFKVHMIEIGVLGVLILIFVIAIILLRRNRIPNLPENG